MRLLACAEIQRLELEKESPGCQRLELEKVKQASACRRWLVCGAPLLSKKLVQIASAWNSKSDQQERETPTPARGTHSQNAFWALVSGLLRAPSAEQVGRARTG